MGLRTVRLGEEGEAILADLREKTGGSISEVLRRGLRSYDMDVNGIWLGGDRKKGFAETFLRLGLPYEDERAVAPARQAKEAVVEVIQERHAR